MVSGLHEAIDEVAAEITPADPPVELTMLRGRRMRNRRRATLISATAGAMALIAAAAVGIPALASRPADKGGATAPASGAPGTVRPIAGAVLMARPVLYFSPPHSAAGYGNASEVNAATMKLFDKLVCRPGPNASTVDPSWKGTVGYSGARAPYDDPNGQIVSCDASGGKYVLDKAVFDGKDITSVATGMERTSDQWVVDLTVDAKARTAFGTLTTNQYNNYYSGYQSGNQDDAVLDQIAVVIDGNVQSAPETDGPITVGQVEISGPVPRGFTQAQARALAARL